MRNRIMRWGATSGCYYPRMYFFSKSWTPLEPCWDVARARKVRYPALRPFRFTIQDCSRHILEAAGDELHRRTVDPKIANNEGCWHSVNAATPNSLAWHLWCGELSLPVLPGQSGGVMVCGRVMSDDDRSADTRPKCHYRSEA